MYSFSFKRSHKAFEAIDDAFKAADKAFKVMSDDLDNAFKVDPNALKVTAHGGDVIITGPVRTLVVNGKLVKLESP